MRQVDEAELVWNIKYQLRGISASLRAQLGSREADKRAQAEQLVAERLVRGALARYEVLSDAPLAPGTDLFTAAAFGGGSGSAPRIEEG